VERADLAGGEVCAVGSRQTGPYGVASQARARDECRVRTQRAGTQSRAQPRIVSNLI
jgi:hypothetical protein